MLSAAQLSARAKSEVLEKLPFYNLLFRLNMGRQNSPLKTHLSTRSAETLSRRIDFWREITATLLSDITSKVFFDHIELENGIKFDEEVKGFEIKLIKQALELVGGKQAEAAKLLDLKRSTLNWKIKRYNIDLGK